MSSKITLVSHSSTSATNSAAFAADEPLDARGAGWATDARDRLPRADRILSSPALSCRQTAQALGLSAGIVAELADWDLGRWRGRGLDDIAAAEPDGVAAWLSDPEAAPHEGERLVVLLARVAAWLGRGTGEGHVLAITHPAVIRAAVLIALTAPPAAFWRIDIAPLTATQLRGRPGLWTVRFTGTSLRSHGGGASRH